MAKSSNPQSLPINRPFRHEIPLADATFDFTRDQPTNFAVLKTNFHACFNENPLKCDEL